MSTLADIVMQGFREAGLIDEWYYPSRTQAAEAVVLLNGLVSSAYGSDAGENLVDWPLGSYGRQATQQLSRSAEDIANPPINSRLLQTADGAVTAHLPPDPSDGSRIAILDPYARLATYNVTLDGNGRTIEGAANVVLATNSLSRVWFYRADTGNWVRVTDLAAGDDFPFPVEFDDMFKCQLAMRLSPRYEATIDQFVLARVKSMERQFAARYAQASDIQFNPSLARRPIQSWGPEGDVSTGEFTRGF